LEENDWETLKAKNPTWNEVDLRDNRYDQIIHLITAANGAEQFYVLDNNICRTEGIEKAREIDEKCAKSWIGHPYFGNKRLFNSIKKLKVIFVKKILSFFKRCYR